MMRGLIYVLLAAEMALMGYYVAVGKLQRLQDGIEQIFKITVTILVITNLKTIANLGINQFETIANTISKGVTDRASNGRGTYVPIDFSDPLQAAVKSVTKFFRDLWEVLTSMLESDWDGITEKNLGLKRIFNIKFRGFTGISIPRFFTLIIWCCLLLFGAAYSVLILFSFISYFIAVLEYHLVMIFAAILIIFKLFRPLTFISERIYSTIFANVVKLGFYYLILAINTFITFSVLIPKLDTIKTDIYDASGGLNAGLAISFIVTIVSMFFVAKMLIEKIPALANSFISGQTSGAGASFREALAVSAGIGLGGVAMAKSLAGQTAAVGGSMAAARNMTGGGWVGAGAMLRAGATQAAKSVGGFTADTVKTAGKLGFGAMSGNLKQTASDAARSAGAGGIERGKANFNKSVQHQRDNAKKGYSKGDLNSRGERYMTNRVEREARAEARNQERSGGENA